MSNESMDKRTPDQKADDRANGSSSVKDAFILVMITLVAALLLSFVYEITKEPIAKQKEKAKTQAYAQVYPGLAGTRISDQLGERAKEFVGADGTTVNECLLALDEAGTPTGVVMSVTTKEGYGGAITLTCGYTLDGTLTGIAFLSLNETAGLGMEAAKPAFRDQFAQKQTKAFGLYKGSTEVITGDSRVDSISSATITSKAVTSAVNSAIDFASGIVAGGLEGYVK